MKKLFIKNILFDIDTGHYQKEQYQYVEVFEIKSDDFLLIYNYLKQSKFVSKDDIENIYIKNLNKIDAFFCQLSNVKPNVNKNISYDPETDLLDAIYWKDNYEDYVKVISKSKCKLYRVITDKVKIEQLKNEINETENNSYDAVVEQNNYKRHLIASISDNKKIIVNRFSVNEKISGSVSLGKLKYSIDLIGRLKHLNLDKETNEHLYKNLSTLEDNLRNPGFISLRKPVPYKVPVKKETPIDLIIDKYKLIKYESDRENIVMAIKEFIEIQNIDIQDFILLHFNKWMNFEKEICKQKQCERCRGLINHESLICNHCGFVWSLNNMSDEDVKAINPKLYNELSIISSNNVIKIYQDSILKNNGNIDKKLSDLIELEKNKIEIFDKRKEIFDKDIIYYKRTIWLLPITVVLFFSAFLYTILFILIPILIIAIIINHVKRETAGLLTKPVINNICIKEYRVHELNISNIHLKAVNNKITKREKEVASLKKDNQKNLKKINHKKKLSAKLSKENQLN